LGNIHLLWANKLAFMLAGKVQKQPHLAPWGLAGMVGEQVVLTLDPHKMVVVVVVHLISELVVQGLAIAL